MSGLNDNAFLLVNRGGVDYKATVQDLRDYVKPKEYEVIQLSNALIRGTEADIGDILLGTTVNYELREIVTADIVADPVYEYRWQQKKKDGNQDDTAWTVYDGNAKGVLLTAADPYVEWVLECRFTYKGATVPTESDPVTLADPKMPWEGKHAIFHVKNATGTILIARANAVLQAWDVTPNGDGTYSWSNERKIDKFNVGDEIVFVLDSDIPELFIGRGNDNYLHNWEFGELTDVSRIQKMENYFDNCQNFNSDISWWDTSSAEDMNNMFNYAMAFNQDISGWNVSKVGSGRDGENKSMLYMFREARAFNQDLSQWCVQHISVRPSYFDYKADSWQDDFKPVWGTCPRGEDQKP